LPAWISYPANAAAPEALLGAGFRFAPGDRAYRRTQNAIEGIATEAVYERRFAEFKRLMVYGEKVGFAACVAQLRELGANISPPEG
jgi:hypothetical protein